MRNNLTRKLPGIVLSAALLILELLFVGLLINTGLLPGKYVALIAILLVVLAGIVYLLVRDLHKKVRFSLGTILIFLLLAGIGVGSFYISKGVNTMEQITEVTVEIADVGVYVRQEDPAQSINETAGYTFGILGEQDRENTDKAITELTETLGESLAVKEYAGLAELLDSLISTGETQAIILNSAFVGLLDEMEGYETAEDQIREVHVQQVETVIERVVEKPKDKEQDKAEDTAEQQENDSVFSVYISGIDSRSGLIAKSRSDVNIVATVNTETRQVLLVSTPRDYYVPLPISNGQPDKLTHAGIYGIDCSMGTLEMLYETEIDYYFRVNFSGFEGIVNALGGITVDSEVAFSSGDYSFVQGENYMDGAAALTFARERYAFASGDRQRGKNQMAVIKGVINKAISPALLTNYTSILESVAGSFEASIPYDVLAALVKQQLSDGGEWNIVSYSVDGTGASKKPYSLSTNAYVMEPDYNTVNQAIAMMEQVKNGEILSQ